MSGLFSSNKPDDMTQAIMDAQITPDAFERLFELFDPLLRRIASRIAPQLIEDALQAARIKMWRKVKLVRLETAQERQTAKAYMVRAAVSGMRDEVRRYLSQSGISRGIKTCSIDLAANKEQNGLPAARFDFNEILMIYKDYIEATGDFAGAHKHAGQVLKISTAQASTRFHYAAKNFLQHLAKEQET